MLPNSISSCAWLTGKHSMKKDDYLVTIMQVPPKQRIPITPFDLKTQREAFTVSLDGLKGVSTGNFNCPRFLAHVCPQLVESKRSRVRIRTSTRRPQKTSTFNPETIFSQLTIYDPPTIEGAQEARESAVHSTRRVCFSSPTNTNHIQCHSNAHSDTDRFSPTANTNSNT